MSWQRTEATTTLRREEAGSRRVVGLAVPYGVLSNATRQLDGAITTEAFAPDAFRASVDHWSTRQDGARMPFRSEHGGPVIGTVVSLANERDGVPFVAEIFESSPAGDEYLRNVDAGLNGVSVEWGPAGKPSRKMRDGSMLHREAKLHAIAGSLSPAYDSSRVAVRDMELAMSENDQETTQDAAPALAARDAVSGGESTDSVTSTPTQTIAERSASEAAAVASRGITPATVTRAEAVYGPRSGQSYFADMLHAREGDTAAAERLERHGRLLAAQAELIERAGDVLSSEIPGAYPNQYLPGLLTPRILKGRPMGNFFQRFPITDAQPKIFPKVTTSSVVAVQSAEGAALSATDLATTAVTATPLMYGGFTDVSRQVLDGADPSVDAMLMQDLIEAYSQTSEAAIKTAVEAGSTASGVAITAATPYAGELANVINYFGTRFLPAQAAFIPPANFTTLASQGDTTGRPFLPMIGATNSDGSIEPGGGLANILGAVAYLSWASTANVNVFARSTDFVIYESSIATFRYDQIVGPQAVRIGIWAYLVVGARLGSLKVTAA